MSLSHGMPPLPRMWGTRTGEMSDSVIIVLSGDDIEQRKRNTGINGPFRHLGEIKGRHLCPPVQRSREISTASLFHGEWRQYARKSPCREALTPLERLFTCPQSLGYGDDGCTKCFSLHSLYLHETYSPSAPLTRRVSTAQLLGVLWRRYRTRRKSDGSTET